MELLHEVTQTSCKATMNLLRESSESSVTINLSYYSQVQIFIVDGVRWVLHSRYSFQNNGYDPYIHVSYNRAILCTHLLATKWLWVSNGEVS